MPWCPACGTEYREGFSICRDCQVPLSDSPPERKAESSDLHPVSETLLTIARDELEFTRIESLMAEAGIPVVKKHHGSGEYLELYMGVSPYGVEVYVPDIAYAQAKALLSGDESILEGTAGSCDSADSPEPPVFLEAHEERELRQYMHAVNQDMHRKKRAIALMMLVTMGAGLVWTVFGLLKELF